MTRPLHREQAPARIPAPRIVPDVGQGTYWTRREAYGRLLLTQLRAGRASHRTLFHGFGHSATIAIAAGWLAWAVMLGCVYLIVSGRL